MGRQRGARSEDRTATQPALVPGAPPPEGPLAEALARQAATDDVLRIIRRSPHDTKPVFEAIAQATLRMCRAEFANVFTFDGTLIHL